LKFKKKIVGTWSSFFHKKKLPLDHFTIESKSVICCKDNRVTWNEEPGVQGDQMSFWKNRPKCDPIHCL
jgi:hypothetical protein